MECMIPKLERQLIAAKSQSRRLTRSCARYNCCHDSTTSISHLASFRSTRHWLPVVSATLALLCAAVYTFRCETVAVGQDENRYQYGVWYRKPSKYEYYTMISDASDTISDLDWSQHVRGGSGNYASSGGDCYSYDDATAIDGLWKFLRAISLLAFLLGAGWTVWMLLCNTVCRRRGREVSKFNWNLQVIILATTLTILNGLGFLFVNTNACSFSDASCKWSTGLRANVAGVVLWTITGVLALWLGPSPALSRRRETPAVQTVNYIRNQLTGEVVEKNAKEGKS